MKNIERIKQMSNSELAEFLSENGKNCEICAYNYDRGDCLGNSCVQGARHWLESECECGGRTTNIEKIKTMNSEELANIMKYPCRICIYHNNGCGLYSSCKEGIKGWLESEEQQ